MVADGRTSLDLAWWVSTFPGVALLVVLTSGVHLGLFSNGTLSLGVATPVTGPRLYNVEAFVQLNWRC